MSPITCPSPESSRHALLLDLSNAPDLHASLQLPDWEFDRATSLEDAQSMLRQQPYRVGVALLSGGSAEYCERIEALLGAYEHLAWIALVRPGDLERQDFRQLIYEHFYDYFTLPLGDNQIHLRYALGHLDGMSRLRELERATLMPVEEFQMVGGSKQFLAIFEQIRRVAGVDAPVLIRGETGVGKELIARAIHQRAQ